MKEPTKEVTKQLSKKSIGMRFQPRDGVILQTIQDYDGVLARRQIQMLFWPGKKLRGMERRLAKLHQAGYINWPSRNDYKTKPIPEPVIWIGWRGALYLAGLQGIAPPPPKGDNLYQLKKLETNLRKAGFRWVRVPRWSLLSHDLAVVDFRLKVLTSLNQMVNQSLTRWISESYFRSNLEVVDYSIILENGMMKKMKKGVCPDGYFEIEERQQHEHDQLHKGMYLLEMDMSTHDNPSFGREKAAAGAAYVKNKLRESYLQINKFRWLIVTNGGNRRLTNLMRQTKKQAGEMAKIFYFTNLNTLKTRNIFLDPIWHNVAGDRKLSLFA